MITIKEKKKCCGCAACATICPHHALTMKADKGGFLYPIVNKNECTNCGLCEKVCPILHEKEERIPTYSYAIKNNDDEIRKKSSSGGLFPLIAEKTIEAGGIVYGASFDKQWNVRHVGITKKEDLHLLQGSKYVQSNTNGIYKDIKQKLQEGINVLFTGTPCQVAGLNHYLQKQYKNLTTIDFICHGVPSPKIWKDYLSEVKDLYKLPITNIEFRNKATGWKDYQFVINFADSAKGGEKTKDYICHHYDNLYMRLFLDNYIVRPSCHSCIFRKGKGGSNYTLGDYWGIHYFNAEFDDNRGTSLFLGYDNPSSIPQCIRQYCKAIETPVEFALKNNPSYTKDWPQSRYSHLFYFFHNYFPLKLLSCFSICLKINKIATKFKSLITLKSIQKKNMKRVAVITFFQSQDNYGQLLQCFALQKILQKLGTSPCVIRYGFHRHYYHGLPWKVLLSKPGFYVLQKNLKIFYHENIRAKYPKRGFNRFRHNYINFTRRCYNSLEDLQRNPPKADIYITGSDQVWAQLISSYNNRSFFLDFGKNSVKRIAYAPSFALENYPKDLQDELRLLLNNFDAVSVREKTGVSICQKVGIHAQLVLDPTLLLTIDDYNFFSATATNNKYCFAYHVNITTSEELRWASVSEYNEQHGIRTYATFANPQDNIDMEFLVGAEYVYPTIPQWLGWIKNAEYVLTSSFHGIIFSIIFHVPFVVCLREESMYAGNDRVITLLNSLCLDYRILSSGTCIETILSKKINWIEVDEKLSALRIDSLAFLSNNL